MVRTTSAIDNGVMNPATDERRHFPKKDSPLAVDKDISQQATQRGMWPAEHKQQLGRPCRPCDLTKWIRYGSGGLLLCGARWRGAAMGDVGLCGIVAT